MSECVWIYKGNEWKTKKMQIYSPRKLERDSERVWKWKDEAQQTVYECEFTQIRKL